MARKCRSNEISSLLQFSHRIAPPAPEPAQGVPENMSATRLRMIGAFAVILGLAFAVSCKGFFVNPTVSSITVGPSNVNIPVGSTQQMAATATFSDSSTGDVTSKSGITWQSSDDTIATVTNTGVVKGVAAGTPTITAQLGTVSGQASVNVTLTNVTSIVVTPSTANIQANGGVATFQAMANVSGQATQVDISSQVAWTISDTTNFTLTQNVTPESVT